MLSLSWGPTGFKVMTHGFGMILLLAVTGLIIGSVLSRMIDCGILGDLVAR
jgi:hypothetical protein